MPLTLLPVELLLMIIAFLNTRDVVLLGRTCKSLHGIAEDERARRQDINRLLSRYVEKPEHFRCLMRDTGAIIVDDFARAFFTGKDTPIVLDLLFPPQHNWDIANCQQRWNMFFMDSGTILPPLRRVNHDGHWTHEVS
jgi:hypothetical protein